jgi:BirA family biotin operon repressor/biotin-[acetyl-CoA-carboxylase] ligase
MQYPDWLNWLETCPSTNTWALEHLATLQHGDVVFTPCQTAGRGQWGRTWAAPAGVLTASFVLREIASVQLGYLSLLVGLSVMQTLETHSPELAGRLQIKWPNDVWLDRRKLAGILSEVPRTKASHVPVVVGIGLNRWADLSQSDLRDRAISLHEVVQSVPDEIDLLTQLRSQLMQLASELKVLPVGAALSPQWVSAINQRDLLCNRMLTVAIGTATIVGQGLGIDWQGGYQIRLAHGEMRSITTGQIIDWA